MTLSRSCISVLPLVARCIEYDAACRTLSVYGTTCTHRCLALLALHAPALLCQIRVGVLAAFLARSRAVLTSVGAGRARRTSEAIICTYVAVEGTLRAEAAPCKSLISLVPPRGTRLALSLTRKVRIMPREAAYIVAHSIEWAHGARRTGPTILGSRRGRVLAWLARRADIRSGCVSEVRVLAGST